MAVYAFGFFAWPYMPKNTPILNNLYYLSIASVVYGLSMVVFLIVTGRKAKVVSCIWLGVSSAALYNELFLNPTHWGWWSAGLVVFISVNLFLSICIIEKLKNKNGSNHNNN